MQFVDKSYRNQSVDDKFIDVVGALKWQAKAAELTSASVNTGDGGIYFREEWPENFTTIDPRWLDDADGQLLFIFEDWDPALGGVKLS